jgi:hypothetical protein
MIFDNQCKLVNDPNGADRMALSEFPVCTFAQSLGRDSG